MPPATESAPAVIEVGTADFAVAQGAYTLASSGIGSCIVICLYDASTKVGGLCHIMLPKRPDNTDLNALRFADSALPLMLEKITQLGGDRAKLTAQIFGGASMFTGLGEFVNKIGSQNIAAVQQLLAEYAIPITRMEVGGTKGRSVAFMLSSGDVTVTTKV